MNDTPRKIDLNAWVDELYTKAQAADARANAAERDATAAEERAQLAEDRIWEIANVEIANAEQDRDAALERATKAEAIIETVKAAIGSTATAEVMGYLDRIHQLERHVAGKVAEIDRLNAELATSKAPADPAPVEASKDEPAPRRRRRSASHPPTSAPLKIVVDGVEHEQRPTLPDDLEGVPGGVEWLEKINREAFGDKTPAEPAPAPAGDYDAGLADMMAAIERVTGKTASFAAAPKPTVHMVKAEPEPAEIEPAKVDGWRSLDPILASLTGEFQTVLQLHASAKAKGYKLGDQSLRYAMTGKPPHSNGLAKYHTDRIEQRDATNPDKDGSTSLAWRLRQPPPNGGKREPAPKAEREYYQGEKVDSPAYPDGFPQTGGCETDRGLARMAWADEHLTPTEDTRDARCQVCDRELQANNGIVRDHGHKRRDGWHEGACMGSGKMPLNLDFRVLKEVIERAIPAEIRYHQETIAKIEDEDKVRVAGAYFVTADTYPDRVKAMIVNGYYSHRPTVITPEHFARELTNHPTWEAYKANKLTQANANIEALFKELEGRKTRLAEWTPTPYLNLKMRKHQRGTPVNEN